MPNAPHPWLELDDGHLSAAELQTELDTRVANREIYHRPTPHFPTFGYVAPMPQPVSGENFAPNLFHHLREYNNLPHPPVIPDLAPSPATRLPLVGPLWRRFRGQVHNLVLFYVNRYVAYGQQRNSHLLNILNELTRLTGEQQREIERLRATIAKLESQAGE
jgi:hypothetical protein